MVLLASCQSKWNTFLSGFTDWKRIVASPLPTGKHKTEAALACYICGRLNHDKGGGQFPAWQALEACICSQPEPSSTISSSEYSFSPGTTGEAHYAVLSLSSTCPPRYGMKWPSYFHCRGNYLHFIQQWGFSRNTNGADLVYWAEKGKWWNVTAQFCLIPCCCSSISVQFQPQYPNINSSVAFATNWARTGVLSSLELRGLRLF